MRARYLILTILLPILWGCSGGAMTEGNDIPKDIYGLNGHSVTTLSGSLFEHFVADSLKEAELMPLSSVAELLAAVSTGKSEYALIDMACIMTVDLEAKGCKVLFETPVASGHYAFGFQHPESELSRQFNEFMDSLKESGTLSEIIDRWDDEDSQTAKMPEFPEIQSNEKPLEAGVYLANFPFGFIGEDGCKGIEPEILYRFGQYIGRPVHIGSYDFAALMPALVSGKADVISGTITVTEERAKKVLFSTPYFYSASICLGRSEVAKEKKSVIQWLKDGVNDNLLAEGRWKMILDGLWLTVLISLFSILLGTLIGALVCWMRMGRSKPLQVIARVYLEILRGIPMLVFLMLMFYVVFASSRMTATTVAVIAFAMNFGAFTSEIFRTGISSVDKGQREAGTALGFSRMQTFIFVILPQATKKILPVFKNEAVSLVKNTSIVGYIAIQDLTKVSDMIRSRTFDAFFPLIVITIIYFLLARLLGHILDQISERV